MPRKRKILSEDEEMELKKQRQEKRKEYNRTYYLKRKAMNNITKNSNTHDDNANNMPSTITAEYENVDYSMSSIIAAIKHDHTYCINGKKSNSRSTVTNNISNKNCALYQIYMTNNVRSGHVTGNENIINHAGISNMFNQNEDRVITDFVIQSSSKNDHTYIRNNKPSTFHVLDNISYINIIQEHYLGDMIDECIHCNAKHFIAERVSNTTEKTYNDCCSHGKVKLSDDADFPDALKSLFTSEHALSSQFFQCIRVYNNLFAFASFNANTINFSERRPGPYCFKIQGQIYYKINTAIHPEGADKPSYGQLFIYDPNEAVQHRQAFNNELNYDIILLIENIMRRYNIFAKSYEMMGEELKKVSSDSSEELNLLFSLKKDLDKRRYNPQRTNEVAAIFSTSADGEIPDAYVVMRNKSTKQLQKVSTMDPNVEPWIYPLFYPTETRYVGPVEATWRILSKPLHDKSHVIVRLPVHLPDCQNIIIRSDPEEGNIENALNKVSMLVDYFALNARDPEARQYSYSEIPEHYRFNIEKIDGIDESKWQKRVKHIKSIGRMYTVNPSQIELFHLRILLLHIKGATSFDDLKTVNGVVHDTFSAACLAHGFIEDDEEWTRAMTEASTFMMPKQLRRLYVRILIHCNPIHPDKLWNDFKNAMSEDFLKHYDNNWRYFTQYSLIHNMRALPEEREFSAFLLKVGDGVLNDSHDNLNVDHFPESCIAAADADIVDDMYGTFF
ncbi:hypothetical protein TKK_0010218 [Trichogramma kaykai]